MESRASGPQTPLFSGEGGRACEQFVRDVRAYAFSQGKQRDNAWMADFASTCLDGAAIRWFMELEPDVQGDWVLLGKALLQQYPPDNGSRSAIVPSPARAASQPTTLPTPAAAPPQALAQSPIPSAVLVNPDWRRSGDSLDSLGNGSPSFLRENSSPKEVHLGTSTATGSLPSPFPVSSRPAHVESDRPASRGFVVPSTRLARDALEPKSTAVTSPPSAPEMVATQAPIPVVPRVGRIRLILNPEDSAPLVKYVRRTTNWFGLFKYTSSVDDALHVSYTPSAQPGAFKLLNGPGDYTYIGITWAQKAQKPVLGPGSTLWAEVAPMSNPSGSNIVTASSEVGASGIDLWTVGPDDIIRATWIDGNKLDPIVASGDWLYMVGDLQAYKKKHRLNHTVRWEFDEL